MAGKKGEACSGVLGAAIVPSERTPGTWQEKPASAC